MSDREHPKILRVRIAGMDCAEEVETIRQAVEAIVAGPDRVTFDILEGVMRVEGAVEEQEVLRAVARTGMRGTILRDGDSLRVLDHGHEHRARTILTVASGALAVGGFAAHAVVVGGVSEAVGREGLGQVHRVPWAAVLLYSAAILAGSRYVVPKAVAAVRRLRPDMNLLMTVAVIGAVFLGEWFEAATVSFLFALSLTLESWSVGRARRAVATLLDLSPQMAMVKDANDQVRSTRVEEIPVGSHCVVRPGDRVPLDGVVVAGSSTLNQAPITGESAPVAKEPGDEVYAGTINGDGVLEVRTSRASTDTTLARIIRLVRDAQGRRANSEQWVERFARVYTPSVMLLATAFLIVPPLLGLGTWSEWLYRSLVLLVIACPCALVISTPVSIVAGLAAAARAGVLIKGGIYLELPARLRAIAFDKTGTLTQGRLAVEQVIPLNGHSTADLLERAAALEAHNTHPLALAILSHARAQDVAVEPASEVGILPGRGLRGRVRGKTFWMGSHRLLEEQAHESPDLHRRLEELALAGRSVVVIGNADHVCGMITFTDIPRDDAAGTIQELRRLGVKKLVMLTGDNRPTAEAIARSVGLTEVRTELLPDDKVSAVEELTQVHAPAAMIGDGVNDAPAMARANLGIAMAAVGSDAAIETADIALMSDDLGKLPWLITHSRRTVAIIRQNIIFSLVVKAIFVGLTFGGLATLWSAIAADMGASLLVVFNGLQLLRPGSAQRASAALSNAAGTS